MLCSAKTTAKKRCRAHAIAGGTVCRVHGGSAPQVAQAAQRRILMAADPVAGRLVSLALARGRDKNVEPQISLVAIRDLLNRAGVVALGKPPESPGGDGTVLWDEFIQIHRRKVPAAE